MHSRRFLKIIILSILLLVFGWLIWLFLPETWQKILLAATAGVLGVFVAVEQLTGMNLTQLLERLIAPPPSLATDFPFYIAESPDQLMKILFPSVGKPLLADRMIPFVSRGLDTELNELLSKDKHILLIGPSKTGKTREAAELLRRNWHKFGLVLILKDRHWLQPPFQLPDQQLPKRNIILFIDDLDLLATIERPDNKKDIHSSDQLHQPTSFETRLMETIQWFKEFTGDSGEFTIIGTANQERLQALGYDETYVPWQYFEVIRFMPLSSSEASLFIEKLAALLEISVPVNVHQRLAEENRGTYTNLILTFLEWKAADVKAVSSAELQTFEGDLKQHWERRRSSMYQTYSMAQFIYAALDIHRMARLPLNYFLVLELAIRIKGGLPLYILQLNRVIMVCFLLPILFLSTRARSNFASQRGNFLKSVREPERHTGFVRRVQLGLPAWSGGLENTLQSLLKFEIPYQGSTITPYEFQVDGAGDSWYSSDQVERILSAYAGLGGTSNLSAAAGDLHEIAEKFQSDKLDWDQLFAFGWSSQYLLSLAAMNSYHRGRYRDALRLYNILIEQTNLFSDYLDLKLVKERAADLHHQRAHSHQRLGNLQLALADFDTAISYAPSDPKHFRCRAKVYGDLLRFEDAYQDLTRCMQLDKPRGWVYHQRAHTLTKLDHIQAAENDFNMAIKLEPKEPAHRRCKAISVHLPQKQFKNAVNDLTVVLTLRGNDVIAYYERGQAFHGLEEFSKAIADFSRAISLKPDYAAAFHQRAHAYQEIGNKQEALADFERSISLEPTSASHYRCRAHIYVEAKEFESALADLNKAIELQPDKINYLYERGTVYARMKYYEKALADFEKAFELQPKNADAYRDQGMAYCMVDQIDKGIENLEIYLQLAPDAPDIAEIKNLIRKLQSV
jgi:tetratricopeptide (TPR) repeat protein